MKRMIALGSLLLLVGAGCVGSQRTVAEKAAAKLPGCTAEEQRAVQLPDARVLAGLGLQPLLDEGFVVAAICGQEMTSHAVAIMAKEELTVPASGIEPTCVGVCDRNLIAVVDTQNGAVSRHDLPEGMQLGIFSEAYDQHCLIDSLIMKSIRDVFQVNLYCGSGESGGMTGWFTYDIPAGTLTAAQVMKTSSPETMEVFDQELVNGFRYKSNAEINQ